MSQGCLIWRDLYIKPKTFIIHIPFYSPGASTYRQSYLHSPAFISLLPAHFRTVSGSYNILSRQPCSPCLLYVKHWIVSQVEGNCTGSHGRCLSVHPLASFLAFQILWEPEEMEGSWKIQVQSLSTKTKYCPLFSLLQELFLAGETVA